MSGDAAASSRLPTLGTLSDAEVRSDPLAFLREATRRHPDLCRYRNGGWNVLLVNAPPYVQHVLQANARNYIKRGSPELMMLGPMLGRGLMTSDGAEWLHQRRMLQPGFHQRMLEGFVAEMARAAEDTARRWRARAAPDEPLELAGEMTRLTLHVVARCLFGYDLSGDATDFGAAVDVMNQTMAHFDPTDSEALARFGRARAVMAGIGRRIASARAESASAPREDLLSLLLAAHDPGTGAPLGSAEVRDQVLTFLMAGHETTAKALTWTLYLLHRHPALLERARSEADAVLGGAAFDTAAVVERLPYAWMAVQEALRIYTPVWSMTRVAHADDEIGGHPVPAGTLVVVSPYALHRRADSWSDPERFDPERFRPELAAGRHPYAYLPFGGGTRVCIGRRFAQLEAPLVLAVLLHGFDFQLQAHPPVEPEALITLRPRHGLWMRVSPRA